MKNYLFAPFKDDEEKIKAFNYLNNNQDHAQKSDLVLFIGRLESYYDAIIGELRSKNAVAVADERIINDLQSELKDEKYYCKEMVSKLQAEIKDLRKGCKLLKDTSHYPKEYKAEADEYFNHNPQSNKVWFFMFDERCMEHIDNLCISEDDAICSIDNERSN